MAERIKAAAVIAVYVAIIAISAAVHLRREEARERRHGELLERISRIERVIDACEVTR